MEGHKPLIISSSPHIRSSQSVRKIMWTVVISLIPAIATGTYLFGSRVIAVILVSVVSSVATEALFQRLMGRQLTIDDGSAVVTGILLALVIPPSVPLWMPAVGSFCSIALAKVPFGGLGYNIFNPALVGRAILLASFPTYMTTWQLPVSMQVDSVTGPTVLDTLKQGDLINIPSIWNMFIGMEPGSIGETSVLALLIGALILFLRRCITWHIPFSYIGCVAFLSFVQQLFGSRNFIMVPINIFSGGLVLGAFFMATDMVTSPITKMGSIVFGLGTGLLTFVIRSKGGYPEGVCYSILIMNAFTPLIDRYIHSKKFGSKRSKK